MWPRFATTTEGRNLLNLHLLGYLFASEMADLTPVQEEFVLKVVLPEVNRQNGAQDPGCSAVPASDGTLREKVERRRREQQA